MTTAKKISILNSQVDKIHPSKELLDIFYDINWKTETLEYIRVFLGEDSEPYKRCKLYNDEADEEHKTKNYTIGSAIWVIKYTEMLFSCIGILQHELYKKPRFSKIVKGVTIAVIIGIIGLAITSAFYVGKADGLHLRNVLIEDTSNNVPKEKTTDRTSNKPKQSHIDSIKK